MSPLRLIVNADDFGKSECVNRGIIKSINDGVVTSTSIMMNMPGAVSAIELAKNNNLKDMGIHFTLTCGTPLTNQKYIPDLVDSNGCFIKDKRYLENAELSQIEKECYAQLKAFLQHDLVLTHIDSHHHVHAINRLIPFFAEIAKKFNVPIRHPYPGIREKLLVLGVKVTGNFEKKFYGQESTLENLKQYLLCHINDDCVLEVMCHPGFVDDELRLNSSYSDERLKELLILTGDEIKTFIREKGILLTNFQNL